MIGRKDMMPSSILRDLDITGIFRKDKKKS